VVSVTMTAIKAQVELGSGQVETPAADAHAHRKGLALLHFSAQRKHFQSGTFGGFTDKTA